MSTAATWTVRLTMPEGGTETLRAACEKWQIIDGVLVLFDERNRTTLIVDTKQIRYAGPSIDYATPYACGERNDATTGD